jgi:hypothetical protein
MIVNSSTYQEVEQDMVATNAATRGNKWETLQARVTPDEKVDIYKHCRIVVRLPYSVITRLIWRRIISQYRTMPDPSMQHDALTEVNRAADDVMLCVPVVRMQRANSPRNY